MTEKRFNLAFYDEYDGTFSIQDAFNQKENKYLHSLNEIVDLLNQLNDENIKMHIQNDFLKDENQHMRDLVNENKQLKEELEFWKKQAKQCPMRSCKNDSYLF